MEVIKAARCRRLTIWVGCRTVLPQIISVELAAFDELETVADIKTIRRAFFESAHPDRQRSGICLFEYLAENSRAYSCSLRARAHVQVVKQEFIVVTFDDYEPHPLSCYHDVACAVWFKTAKKSFACAHWIKAPDTLKTFAHGFDSNSDQIVQVALLSGDQGGEEIGCEGHHAL